MLWEDCPRSWGGTGKRDVRFVGGREHRVRHEPVQSWGPNGEVHSRKEGGESLCWENCLLTTTGSVVWSGRGGGGRTDHLE